jgi:hypothetical protein
VPKDIEGRQIISIKRQLEKALKVARGDICKIMKGISMHMSPEIEPSMCSCDILGLFSNIFIRSRKPRKGRRVKWIWIYGELPPCRWERYVLEFRK